MSISLLPSRPIIFGGPVDKSEALTISQELSETPDHQGLKKFLENASFDTEGLQVVVPRENSSILTIAADRYMGELEKSNPALLDHFGHSDADSGYMSPYGLAIANHLAVLVAAFNKGQDHSDVFEGLGSIDLGTSFAARQLKLKNNGYLLLPSLDVLLRDRAMPISGPFTAEAFKGNVLDTAAKDSSGNGIVAAASIEAELRALDKVISRSTGFNLEDAIELSKAAKTAPIVDPAVEDVDPAKQVGKTEHGCNCCACQRAAQVHTHEHSHGRQQPQPQYAYYPPPWAMYYQPPPSWGSPPVERGCCTCNACTGGGHAKKTEAPAQKTAAPAETQAAANQRVRRLPSIDLGHTTDAAPAPEEAVDPANDPNAAMPPEGSRIRPVRIPKARVYALETEEKLKLMDLMSKERIDGKDWADLYADPAYKEAIDHLFEQGDKTVKWDDYMAERNALFGISRDWNDEQTTSVTALADFLRSNQARIGAATTELATKEVSESGRTDLNRLKRFVNWVVPGRGGPFNRQRARFARQKNRWNRHAARPEEVRPPLHFITDPLLNKMGVDTKIKRNSAEELQKARNAATQEVAVLHAAADGSTSGSDTRKFDESIIRTISNARRLDESAIQTILLEGASSSTAASLKVVHSDLYTNEDAFVSQWIADNRDALDPYVYERALEKTDGTLEKIEKYMKNNYTTIVKGLAREAFYNYSRIPRDVLENVLASKEDGKSVDLKIYELAREHGANIRAAFAGRLEQDGERNVLSLPPEMYELPALIAGVDGLHEQAEQFKILQRVWKRTVDTATRRHDAALDDQYRGFKDFFTISGKRFISRSDARNLNWKNPDGTNKLVIGKDIDQEEDEFGYKKEDVWLYDFNKDGKVDEIRFFHNGELVSFFDAEEDRETYRGLKFDTIKYPYEADREPIPVHQLNFSQLLSPNIRQFIGLLDPNKIGGLTAPDTAAPTPESSEIPAILRGFPGDVA